MNSDVESAPESDAEDDRYTPDLPEGYPLDEDDTVSDTMETTNDNPNMDINPLNSAIVNSQRSESNSNLRNSSESSITNEQETRIARADASSSRNGDSSSNEVQNVVTDAFESIRRRLRGYDENAIELPNVNLDNPVNLQNRVVQNTGAPLPSENNEYSNDTARSGSVQPSESEEVMNDEPPSKIAKLECPEKRKRSDSEANDADGETCSICLDAWSNSGDHRLIALKCGHLFGHQCIIRWLNSQNAKTKSCPTCKSKAAIRDIRFIYARKLVAADTSEIEILKKELETAKSEKSRAELELQKSLLNQKMYLKQVTELRSLIKDLESCIHKLGSGGSNNRKPEPVKKWKLSLEKTLEICKDNGCRVLTYNCRKYELYVSQQSTNNLFPGFGVKKVSCIDYRLGQFILLHPKPIRDVSYSQPNDMVLSVSLDKTAKLIVGQTGQISSTFNCGMPLWSCSWDELMPQQFYVGAAGGVVLVYDVRQPNSYLDRLTVPGDYSPIVSLASIPSGFLSCHLSSCWIYRRNGSTYTPQLMPMDGPFLGLNYDKQTEQILVSCRPSQQNPYARHIVCNIDNSNADDLRCNTVHTFRGSVKQTLMSRSCFLNVAKEAWVAAHSESENGVALWSVNTEERVQVLPSQDHVIDMCSISQSGDTLLATLSQNRMRIYKAVSS